jgi:hypothetical protein
LTEIQKTKWKELQGKPFKGKIEGNHIGAVGGSPGPSPE